MSFLPAAAAIPLVPVINYKRLENELGSILKETTLKTIPDDLDPKPRKPQTDICSRFTSGKAKKTWI